MLRDHVPYVRQSVAEAAVKDLRADGDSERDEDDEHGVFCGCGAALVLVEAMIRPSIFDCICQGWKAILLTMFHHGRTQSGVSKASLP